MRPTEILTGEHRVIEMVLSCLEKMAQEAETTGKVDKSSAEQAIDFIRNFADGCHHGKEETHLFPAMESKGIPKEHGPIGMMLFEHEQGRAYVRGMAESLDGAAMGDKTALEAFIVNANGYVGLLRTHIQKEDHILFPMAGRVMDETDEKALMAQFEKVETEHMGIGTHEKYLKIAQSLAERYGIDKSALGHMGHSCGCGHAAAHHE
jgi:hemerythrin-like domain-containing protein